MCSLSVLLWQNSCQIRFSTIILNLIIPSCRVFVAIHTHAHTPYLCPAPLLRWIQYPCAYKHSELATHIHLKCIRMAKQLKINQINHYEHGEASNQPRVLIRPQTLWWIHQDNNICKLGHDDSSNAINRVRKKIIRFTKRMIINPEKNMNVCTTFENNPSSSLSHFPQNHE